MNKKIRTDTYWREQNYSKVIEKYQQINKLRNISKNESQWDPDTIERKLNSYHNNGLLDINRPLSNDEVKYIADKFSKGDYEFKFEINDGRRVVSLKQAEYLSKSAKDLGWNVSVQDIISGSVDYYVIRDAIRKLTGWEQNEIDMYIYGS